MLKKFAFDPGIVVSCVMEFGTGGPNENPNGETPPPAREKSQKKKKRKRIKKGS